MRTTVLLIPMLLLSGCGFSSSGGNSLSINQAAPTFTATTLDGSPFQLKDLRGKVVVLDFWATWCPPCRAMIPHEREMVKRLAGKPFALVSISADDEADRLRDFVRDERMAWTHICDGPDGPIGQAFDISYYPTIFVLDAKGVIRYKDVRDQELERAVEKLLAEMGR